MRGRLNLKLATLGLITTLVIDLIGVVAFLVLDVRHDSPLGLWGIAFIAGLTAGAIIGAFASPVSFLFTAGASSGAATLLFGLFLTYSTGLDATGNLQLIAALFQLVGALIGAFAGQLGQAGRHPQDLPEDSSPSSRGQ